MKFDKLTEAYMDVVRPSRSPRADAAANSSNAEAELFKLAGELERKNKILKQGLEKYRGQINSEGQHTAADDLDLAESA